LAKLQDLRRLRAASPEQGPQLHSGLMQLGLAVPYGASQHLGYFIVLVSFDVMEYEDDPISRREPSYGVLKRDSVNRAMKHIISRSKFFR
jgi:hypothetical protein